jgi:hypothetical protein
VKSIMQQLFSKTGVRTRSQLVRVVMEQQGSSANFVSLNHSHSRNYG